VQGAPDVEERVSGPDAWARSALARLGALPGVVRVGIALAEGGGRRLLFVASDRENDPDPDWCHIDAYQAVPLNAAVRTGELVAAPLAELAARYPDFAARQRGTATVALAAVPVWAAHQVLGGFVLFYDRPQDFDPRQRADLAGLGTELGEQLRREQRAQGRRGRRLADQPVPAGARRATYDVPAEPAAVRGARRWLDDTLDSWRVDAETAATAVLCLSELVTNAVLHAHTGCEVRAVLEDGVLTVTVRDGGSASVGSPGRSPGGPADPLAVHGRGLQLVDALATRWGSDLDEVGTTVWFVLER
jgi:anti-sigma regulatory factor (Ser/Thr protein kinase)